MVLVAFVAGTGAHPREDLIASSDRFVSWASVWND